MRFNKELQFHLMEGGDLVMSANARGLLYIEHFRPKHLTQQPEGAEGIFHALLHFIILFHSFLLCKQSNF